MAYPRIQVLKQINDNVLAIKLNEITKSINLNYSSKKRFLQQVVYTLMTHCRVFSPEHHLCEPSAQYVLNTSTSSNNQKVVHPTFRVIRQSCSA